MKLAAARMMRLQPRLFDGCYCAGNDGLGCLKPLTTGDPAKARVYEDHAVAHLVVDFLNVLDGIQSGERKLPWIVMPLPEQWT